MSCLTVMGTSRFLAQVCQGGTQGSFQQVPNPSKVDAACCGGLLTAKASIDRQQGQQEPQPECLGELRNRHLPIDVLQHLHTHYRI